MAHSLTVSPNENRVSGLSIHIYKNSVLTISSILPLTRTKVAATFKASASTVLYYCTRIVDAVFSPT